MANDAPRRYPPLKEGDVHPSHVFRDIYGMNAANRPTIIVNPDEVPESLRFLIPQVERWAIPCDVTRHDYFDQQPEEDIVAFWHGVLPFKGAVKEWLDSQSDDVLEWPDAAIHFMYFLKAHGEAYQPTDDERKAWAERDAAWKHKRERENAISIATDAFKRHDYAATVQLLTPYEAELDKIMAAKLQVARKKIS
jgi:hypothetical protein